MYKKLFTVLLVAVLLVTSIGVISAAATQQDSGESMISVEIDWDDSSYQSERPAQVSVNLLHDGKVVDTKTLNASNSWKTTFIVQGDAEGYSVEEVTKLEDYNVSSKGNAEKGFIITHKIIKDTLGASENEKPLKVNNDTANNTNASNNSTTNVTNQTTKETSKNDTKITEKVTKKDDSKAKPDVAVKDDSKKVKKDDKKAKNETKNKLKNTGIPIAGLVIVAFAVAFVPFTRKK